MGVDAVALFRPKRRTALRPLLAPTGGEPHAYAEPLADGAIAIHTQMPFRAIAADPNDAREWLSDLDVGLEAPIDLALAHADPRGLAFIPDTAAVLGRPYESVLREHDADVVWVVAERMTKEERAARVATRERAAETEGATPSRELAQLFHLMKEGRTDRDVLLAQASRAASRIARGAANADEPLVLLVRRSSWLGEGDGIARLDRLADGTTIVTTTRTVGERNAVAHALAGPWARWLAHHDDPQGVPSFPRAEVERARTQKTYAEAVHSLGDDVVYLVPRTLEDRMKEQQARLRAFFNDET